MIGKDIGPYRVLERVGAGGMGEVYRARDPKLARDVALKILPEAFARDADRLARFKREAQVLASLNHPNIAAIHGFEEADARQALVLEFVDGPTLADRLAQGAMPVEEALAIARQIADALEAAHAQGVIHRDLKPANIKVRPDGTVKLLDFGLAKALDAGDGSPMGGGTGLPSPDVADSPTITSPAMTMRGVILGTAAYMAPEQARGRTVDRRADIWAFGCVLYEILTGRRAFDPSRASGSPRASSRGDGRDIADTLAFIITKEPDWTALPASTPPAIVRLLRRALEKDPGRRLRHIGDAAIEIDEAQAGASGDGGTPSAASRGRERAAWIAALTLVSAVAVALAVGRLAGSAVAPEIRVEINTPPTTDPASIAISPDGHTIAFVATDGGRPRLWLRSLDTVSVRPLAGTDGAQFPFWAPNGRALGFFADDGKLKRVDLDGGVVRELARAGLARGGAWGADGTILFVPSTGPVFRLPPAGGAPTAVTRIAAQQSSHAFPAFLPDGNHFVYWVTGSPEVRGVYVAGLDGTGERRLVDTDSIGVSMSKGYLLFVRGNTLFAQQLDPGRLQLAGSPFPVVESMGLEPLLGFQRGSFSATGAGHIIFRSGSASHDRQFVWFDRQGNEVGRVGRPDAGSPFSPAMSPDGRRIALHRTVDGNVDIWLLDTDRGGISRLTTHAANEIHPLWSPDGSRMVFTSNRSGSYQLYEKSALGASEEKLLRPMQGRATDWSRDGRWLLFEAGPRSKGQDILALRHDSDQETIPLVQTEFDERDGQFSPDGRWIAYSSVESGRWEVYVQPFPGPGVRSPISIDGGAQPRWRSDGKELFFIALDGRLMAVPMSLPSDGRPAEAGRPVPLFLTRVGGAVQNPSRPQYFVSPDGSRFLMNTVLEGSPTPPIALIVNWKPRRGTQE